MKILLNGLPVVYPISGVGTYTLQLGRSLEALLGPEKIFWFGKDLSHYSETFYDTTRSGFIDRIRYKLKNELRKIPGLKKVVHIGRNNQFRSFTLRIKPSLYHETNYVPFCFENGPTVVTICDLSFIRHPEWHPLDRVKYFEKYCLKRLSQVEAVITISEFTKKEMLTLLNVDQAKIYITPLGVDGSFSPGEKKLPGLPDKYILYLGNLEPRKNLPMLLSAFRRLPGNLQDRYSLVMAGAKGWCTNELGEMLRSFQKDGKLILTGYVPQTQLPKLYRGASLFVYPSLYEGFGLPVIEAMASGVPVVASNTTSLPEVVGDAGILVSPHDVEGWNNAMNRILNDEEMRSEMSQKGLARATLFSWEKCAQETVAVYKKVLGSRR